VKKLQRGEAVGTKPTSCLVASMSFCMGSVGSMTAGNRRSGLSGGSIFGFQFIFCLFELSTGARY
jgi:hypothetical protein